MAHMVPPLFPHNIAKRPHRAGEMAVYDALHAALPHEWLVAYERPIPGSRRRIDFVVLHPDHGVAAIEVKGGQVHARRGRFLQLIRPRPGAPQHRKRVDPFAQAKFALAALLGAAKVEEPAIPVHIAMALPLMGNAAFSWQPSSHILTRELLEPLTLQAVLMNALPPHGEPHCRAALARIADVVAC